MDKQTVDAVSLMRSIRDRLFESFQKDKKAEVRALEKVRSKYKITVKQQNMRVATPPPEYSKNAPESDQ